MREALMAHRAALPDSVRVTFSDFGKDAIEIEASAQLSDAAASDEAAAREDLLLRLFDVVEKSGGTLVARA
jgi:hypothetical protein